MPRLGCKIALNDAGVRRKLGIPLVGSLVTPALEPGQPYHPPRNGNPRVEAEVALRLRKAVASDASG